MKTMAKVLAVLLAGLSLSSLASARLTDIEFHEVVIGDAKESIALQKEIKQDLVNYVQQSAPAQQTPAQHS